MKKITRYDLVGTERYIISRVEENCDASARKHNDKYHILIGNDNDDMIEIRMSARMMLDLRLVLNKFIYEGNFDA